MLVYCVMYISVKVCHCCTSENESGSHITGVALLLLSHWVIYSSLAYFNLWNIFYSTLYSVCAMAPSMAESSQSTLHMTAGFGIKERKLRGRQRQAPSDEILTAAIRRPRRGFTVQPALFAFIFHMHDWRDVSGGFVGNTGGGSLYRSRSRWQKWKELTDWRWLQLVTFQLQERLFKAAI